MRFARNLRGDVEFSPEDGYRSRARLPVPRARGGDRARARPRSTSPTPSATRCPSCTASSSATLRERIPNSDKAVWSVHCHNDLGMAVANSLAGVQDRRRAPGRVHDQRPGRARRQLLARGNRDGGAHPAATTSASTSASTRRRSCRRRSWCRRSPASSVQPNKAVVGANAFAHASGIHQDGVLKARDTYEIMRAEDVGWAANKIVLGKLSGRNAFKQRLQELGIELRERGRHQRRVRALQGAGRHARARSSTRTSMALVARRGRDAAEQEHYQLVVADAALARPGERPHAKRRLRGGRARSTCRVATATARSTPRFKAIEVDGRRAAPRCCSISVNADHHRHRVAGRSDGAPVEGRAGSSTASAPIPTSSSRRPRPTSAR